MTRKFAPLTLPLAAAVLLCACGAPAASGSAAEPQTAEVQAAEMQTDASSPAALYQLAAKGSVGMKDDAVYLPMQTENNTVVASKIDAATGAQTVLCQKAGCTHDSADCDAYLYTIGMATASSPAALLPDGDTLYWVCVDYKIPLGDGTEIESYLDVSDLNGQNRTRLLDLTPWLDEIGGMVRNETLWFSDGSSLYFPYGSNIYRMDANGVQAVFSPTLTHNEAGRLYSDATELEENRVYGCFDGKLVLCHYDGFTPPAFTDDDRAAWEKDNWSEDSEEYQDYMTEFTASADAAKCEILLLDAAGNTQDTGISYSYSDANGGMGIAYSDGKAYRILGETDAATQLWVADLATGQTETRALPQGGAWWNGKPNAVYGSKVILTQNEMQYVWDTADDSVTELSAVYYKDQVAPRSASVLACTQNTAFLLAGMTEYTATDVDTDGQVYTYLGLTPHYAVGSLNGYLAGEQNWVGVTLPSENATNFYM